MPQYSIKCETLAELIKVCAGLVQEGVTFQAQTHNLTVILTGGF
jgi:hypothetical protein